MACFPALQMRTPLRIAAVLALSSLAVVACSKNKGGTTTTTQQAGHCAPTDPPDTVVATWEGGKLTAGELDKELEKQLRQMDAEYQKQRFELRRSFLERMVLAELVSQAARKQNMMLADGGADQDKWVIAEIESKVPPATEEQMMAMYEQVKERLPPGTTYEMVKEQLGPAANGQAKQAQAAKVFENLKNEANVKILLATAKKQVEAKGPSRGPDDAKVTIVEFSDFECPFCSKAKNTVDKVMEAYPGKVKLVFRQYPLPMHPNAPKAAEAALCAGDQGKFWEMHDKLFENQRALNAESYKSYATALGLDDAKFTACMDSGEKAKIVAEDMKAGDEVGVGSTPTFFINGRELSGAQPEEEFKRIIDEELKGS